MNGRAFLQQVAKEQLAGGTSTVNRWEIQGIARGISRQQTERKLLPYVEPTTDWIRLERRFPVTLVLQDADPGIVLHMGADARTLIIY